MSSQTETQLHHLINEKKWEHVLALCEDAEIETEGNSSNLYPVHLFTYLIVNDLNSAKYLWKRIPKNNKEDSTVLQSIWNVGKTLIKKEYKNVYQVGLCEWDTPQLQLLCDAFIESFRTRQLHLVSEGYSSIKSNVCAQYLGMDEENTVEYVTKIGWTFDKESGLIHPVKEDEKKSVDISDLQSLTSYVVHLEK